MPKELRPSSSDTPPPKPRGRPLKARSNPAVELQRARVRRAQKAFRSRKEQHLAKLESKCRTLEQVVEEMTTTFIAFSDGLLSLEGVEREVDGRVKRELRGTMERFLELGRRAARDVDEEGEVGDEEEEGEKSDQLRADDGEMEIGMEMMEAMRSCWPGAEDFPDSGRVLPLQGSLTPASSSRSIDPYTQPETLTHPNLTWISNLPTPETASTPPSLYRNDIWSLAPPSKPTAVSQPTSSATVSAIPYILAGRSSFATHLYFATISIAVRSLRGDAPASFAHSFFRYKFRHVSPLRIRGVVDGVLNMLLHGTSQIKEDPSAGLGVDVAGGIGESEDEEVINAAIEKSLEGNGERKEEYLGSWDVERYLKRKWRLALDSNTVRIQPRAVLSSRHSSTGFGGFGDGGSEDGDGSAVVDFAAPTMIPGFEHAAQRIWDASELVERLLAVSVTIGEGPRWHYGQIDAVVEAFLMENGGGR